MKYALIEDYVKAEKSIVKLRRTIKELEEAGQSVIKATWAE